MNGSTMRHYTVAVTDHAKDRARERFPELKLARISDEVRRALEAGRVSTRKPEGLRPPDDPFTLYAWTPDTKRVYALRADSSGDGAFVVITTMRTEA